MSKPIVKPVPPHPHHPYPVLAHVLGMDQAKVVASLYHYVRPGGDWVLVRSDLDALDQAFQQIEDHLARNMTKVRFMLPQGTIIYDAYMSGIPRIHDMVATESEHYTVTGVTWHPPDLVVVWLNPGY